MRTIDARDAKKDATLCNRLMQKLQGRKGARGARCLARMLAPKNAKAQKSIGAKTTTQHRTHAENANAFIFCAFCIFWGGLPRHRAPLAPFRPWGFCINRLHSCIFFCSPCSDGLHLYRDALQPLQRWFASLPRCLASPLRWFAFFPRGLASACIVAMFLAPSPSGRISCPPMRCACSALPLGFIPLP